MAQSKRGKFTAQVGSRKIAKENMKNKEHQFVIDGYLVNEVLKQIPNDIKIIQAKVIVLSPTKRNKILVPLALKKIGVYAIKEQSSRKELEFIFDEVSKTKLEDSVREGCKSVGTPYDLAYIQYIVLSNGKGTGRFVHTRKEVAPDDTDLRKKLRVLGITTGKGQVQGLISDIGAKKFHCTIKEEPVKFIMCSRE